MQGFNEEMAQEINIDWNEVLANLTAKLGQKEQELAIKDNVIKQLSERLDEKEVVAEKPKSKK